MKKLFVLFSAALCGLSLWAASGGSEASAVSISAGATEAKKVVKLIAGKDWDDGSYVYYLKMTLKKNRGYTVWFEGGDAAEIGLDGFDVYAYEPGWDDDFDDDWDDDFDDDWGGGGSESPFAGFFESAVQAGNYVMWMDADSWDSEDPSSWTYYIQLSATNAFSTTVHVQEGRQSFLPRGMAENPEPITMGETETPLSRKTTEEGAYYFSTTLEAGRKYLVHTTGGTAACPFGLSTLAFSNFNDEADPAYTDPYNAAYAIYPLEDGAFKFVVSCSDTNVPFASTTNVPFGFCYRAVPKRPIGEHPLKATVTNGVSVSFQPGRIVSDLAYYDDIIDECLFKIDGVRKGERWVFDSTGANTNCEMRLYDSKGNILATNGTVGNGSFDVRIGLDAEADGPYYVGVCDPALGQADTPVLNAVFTARKVEADDGETMDIAPFPAPGTADPVTSGSSDGPFALSDACWSQTFRFGARKNQGFSLSTSLVSEGSNLDLLAEVFRLSGSTEKPVELISGQYLTPGNVIGFIAPANGEYYVRVSVAQGKGLDFPAFKIHAIGYENGVSSLGILTVVTKGADGQWTLDKESTKYSGGVSLMVSGSHTVKFASVKGFNIVARGPDGVGTKSSWTGTVAAGTKPTVVTGEYSDTSDPKDDVKKGAVSLKVSSKETDNGRTLWEKDGADWFKFSAKDGVYYNFEIIRIGGDAVMTVYDANEMAVSDLFGVQKIVKQSFAKGTYYIKVFHANSPAEDGAYTLRTSSAQAGSIKFGKTAIKATDSTGKVTLTVKRTAKEGKVRVRYATVDGTAKAGTDFISQDGELSWEANDKKDKTIVVKLIPPLVPVAKGTTKQFTVELSALAEKDIAEDEYPAQVIGGPATITISGTAKAGVDPYAVKKATGKEVADSWVGTFSGVLTNGTETGTDRLASVTLTAKSNGKLSAKVIVGGSTLSLSAKSWASVTVESQIATLTSKKGDANLVLFADGSATLTFDGDETAYAGVLARNNSKVQAYLDKIVDYVGYYTVSLLPGGETGVPGGCGYLTLTLDNKGAVKVAGLLGDGTKVSGKSVASIRDDGSLLVPVFAAKGAYCFGGTLKVDLVARACDGRKVPCVDSSCKLVWNKEGSWEAEVSPVGGYYDTIINLQAYYNGLNLSMDGIPVEVDSNALVVEKNAEGDNVSGVTFSFTRKTGLFKGKLSYNGGKSVAYNGVMLLTTDEEKQDVVGRAFFISNSVSYPLSIVAGGGDALMGFVELW